MSEVNLDFIYQGSTIRIQCERGELMKDIIKRYIIKICKDINDIYFMCNGSKINAELKLEEINNKDKEIKILVNDINNKDTENKEKIKEQYKDVLCPKCGNICSIDIQDYKIILDKCINKHSIENILLDEYDNLQKNINKENILCNSCNKNKNEIFKKNYVNVVLGKSIYVHYVNQNTIKTIY